MNELCYCVCTLTNACVGKKLGCAYGFVCVDMRSERRRRPEIDETLLGFFDFADRYGPIGAGIADDDQTLHDDGTYRPSVSQLSVSERP